MKSEKIVQKTQRKELKEAEENENTENENTESEQFRELKEAVFRENTRDLTRYLGKENNLNKDYASGAEIVYVSQSQLPENVLGMYDPVSHTIYISSANTEYENQFVRKHESGHALGIIDEFKTDVYASAQTGYNLRNPLNQFRFSRN